MKINGKNIRRKKNKPCRHNIDHAHMLKKFPFACPSCDGRDVVRLKVLNTNTYGTISVLTQCQDCLRAWTEVYKLDSTYGIESDIRSI